MEKIIEFATDNLAWILTITIILVFAFIGYMVDNYKSKKSNKDFNEEYLEEYIGDKKLNDTLKMNVIDNNGENIVKEDGESLKENTKTNNNEP